jgi:hypothetical protein
VESRAENRAHRRWSHAGPVYFEPGTLDEAGRIPAAMQFLAQAVDISQGGIGLVTRLSLREKDVIRILIPGPEPSMSLPLRAEVVWAVPASASTRYGLRFLA